MAKKLRHALEIIWHNPTTRIVNITGHRVIDFFQRIYLSTTLKPYKLQLDTLTSIGPYFSPLAEGGPGCIFRSPKFLLKFV